MTHIVNGKVVGIRKLHPLGETRPPALLITQRCSNVALAWRDGGVEAVEIKIGAGSPNVRFAPSGFEVALDLPTTDDVRRAL